MCASSQRSDRPETRSVSNTEVWKRGLLGTTKNATAVLDPGQSAALRDKLLTEVANLTSSEFAVTWAAGALGAKNSLIAADAKLLEEAFEQKLASAQLSAVNETSISESAATAEARPGDRPQVSGAESDQPRGIDKSVLAVAAPRRYRNREHLRYVAQQPCLVCGRKPSDPPSSSARAAAGARPQSQRRFVVPLCRSHHRAVHRASNEQAWWDATDIDPIKVARKLWKHTRVNEGRVRLDGNTQGRGLS
jgi:hypothetical protein